MQKESSPQSAVALQRLRLCSRTFRTGRHACPFQSPASKDSPTKQRLLDAFELSQQSTTSEGEATACFSPIADSLSLATSSLFMHTLVVGCIIERARQFLQSNTFFTGQSLTATIASPTLRPFGPLTAEPCAIEATAMPSPWRKNGAKMPGAEKRAKYARAASTML